MKIKKWDYTYSFSSDNASIGACSGYIESKNKISAIRKIKKEAMQKEPGMKIRSIDIKLCKKGE